MADSAKPQIFGEDLPSTERSRIDNLRTEIAELFKLEPQAVRAELGPSLSFKELEYIVVRVHNLASLLRDGRLDEVWGKKIDEISSCLAQFRGLYQQMAEFDPKVEPNQVFGRRAELINKAKELFSAFSGSVVPILPFVMLRGVGLDDFRANAADQAEKMINEGLAVVQRIKETEANAKDTLDKIKSTAGEVGVAKYANFFKAEADANGWYSWWWGLGAFVFALATCAFTLFVFEPHVWSSMDEVKKRLLGPGFFVPLALSRLILVSLMYLGVVWCIRNFSAARHNLVVNRHRQNALSSFEAFVKAAEADAQTKNAVLLQATQCIFSPQASGYLKADNDMPGGGQVIEIFRGLAGKGGE